MMDMPIKDSSIPFSSNIVEFNKAFRELKTELLLKRNENSELKSELDQVHRENFNLKQSLEKLKKSLDENKITLDLFMQKTKDFEPKYYEKRDALVKLELQYKMEASTINMLRESFQKALMEKSELSRKLNMLEEKQKQDLSYMSEVKQSMDFIRNQMETIKGDMEIINETKLEAAKLLECVNFTQESVQKCEEMSKLIDKLTQERDGFEQKAVMYKAKSESLEAYISANNCIFAEDNLEARVILTQLKKSSAHYHKTITTKNEIITNLNESLLKERQTSAQLIKEIEEKSKPVAELEANLEGSKAKEPVVEENMVAVKLEDVIMITDSPEN